MPTVISVENLSKSYRLGRSVPALSRVDLEAWRAKGDYIPPQIARIMRKKFVEFA